MPRVFLPALSFAISACAISACGLAPHLSPYRIEIQQGNYVTQEAVAQLKPEMTRDQVRFVLGTPLVSDIFHRDRWDYVFLRQRANRGEVEYRRFVVFFEDGKLKRVEGDIVAVPGATVGAEAFARKADQ
jgi:outer membrane protein assembly factor BamE